MNDKKYIVVDKETGEVVGETNTTKEPRRPFLTLLSWISLIACATAFYYLQRLYLEILLRIYYYFTNSRGALFIILLLGIDGTLIGVGIWLTFWGAAGTSMLSQKIRSSRRGTRYVIFGLIWGLFYILLIVMIIKGLAIPDLPWFTYAECGIMIAYSVLVVIFGKSQSVETAKAA